MMRSTLVLIALTALHAGVSEASLYSQPWTGIFQGLGSDNTQQIADNFSLTNDAEVAALTWYGIGTNGNLDALSVLDFTIRFYENVPLSPIQAHNLNTRPELYPFAEASVQAQVIATGLSQFSPTNPIPITRSLFEFRADLPMGVTLDGGETYWVSILAAANFAWAVSGPGEAAFRVNGDGSPWLEMSAPQTDLTFSLLSQPHAAITEPTTFAVWSLLAATATGTCWWRRH